MVRESPKKSWIIGLRITSTFSLTARACQKMVYLEVSYLLDRRFYALFSFSPYICKMTAFKHSALPSQILLWSLPRSGCHLLEKMVFSKQGNLKYCWHPNEAAVIHFHNLFSGQDIQDEANQNRKGFESKCREAAEAWRTKLQEAQDAVCESPR